MNASNWDSFINENFVDDSKYILESNDFGDVKFTMVSATRSESSSFIRFEIDKNNLNRIIKLEFGSKDSGILCKGLFNSAKEFNLEFVQNSWFDNEGKSYELLFNDENARNLLVWLELPLKGGWKETHFYFKNSLYKVGLTYEANNKKKYHELILQTFEEQDLPLPFDSIFNKIRKLFIELAPNSNKPVLTDRFVTPIL